MISVSITEKVCLKCQQTFPSTDEYFYRKGKALFARCKRCVKSEHKKYYDKNRERSLKHCRKWYAENKVRHRELGKLWVIRNRERSRLIGRTNAKAGRARLKLEFIEAYGGRCACCGESNPVFLTLEHLNGGGTVHHDKRGTSGMLRDIRREGFPKDRYAVLCYNCNCGKAKNGGVCPHQAGVEVTVETI